MTVTDIVTIRGLDYSYGQTHALRGVDLTVGAGECVALLGPNGAGKTTLVSTLTGTLVPAAGTVRITGNDPRRPATRRRLRWRGLGGAAVAARWRAAPPHEQGNEPARETTADADGA